MPANYSKIVSSQSDDDLSLALLGSQQRRPGRFEKLKWPAAFALLAIIVCCEVFSITHRAPSPPTLLGEVNGLIPQCNHRA
jgi:hypothetical protein